MADEPARRCRGDADRRLARMQFLPLLSADLPQPVRRGRLAQGPFPHGARVGLAADQHQSQGAAHAASGRHAGEMAGPKSAARIRPTCRSSPSRGRRGNPPKRSSPNTNCRAWRSQPTTWPAIRTGTSGTARTAAPGSANWTRRRARSRNSRSPRSRRAWRRESIGFIPIRTGSSGPRKTGPTMSSASIPRPENSREPRGRRTRRSIRRATAISPWTIKGSFGIRAPVRSVRSIRRRERFSRTFRPSVTHPPMAVR